MAPVMINARLDGCGTAVTETIPAVADSEPALKLLLVPASKSLSNSVKLDAKFSDIVKSLLPTADPKCSISNGANKNVPFAYEMEAVEQVCTN